jgi:geranylgeranyl pyrophosphate synthase
MSIDLKSIPALRAKINKRIEEVLLNELSKLNLKKLSIPISRVGKRLRPILLLLITNALKGDEEEALDAAVGVELIHNSSLVFDDIIDKAIVRRGFQALHQVYGEGMAISIGLFLASKGVQMLTSYNNRKIDEILAEALVQLSEGEMLDSSSKDKIEADKYLAMIRLKTGTLFGLSSAVGAILGGCFEKEVKKLWKYGVLIGMSYQLNDDLRDFDVPLIVNANAHNFNFLNFLSDIIEIERLKQCIEESNSDCTSSSEAFRKKTSLYLMEEAEKTLKTINNAELAQSLKEFANILIDS